MPEPSISQIKAAMREAWNAGDFGVIARTIEQVAVDFANSIPDPEGKRALDIATGSGNVALPLAARGAEVTGVDIATRTLAEARARASAAHLNIQFDEGDAEALPYANASFDMVVTMFGAMFAPRPEVVASEIARVLRPGGVLAMANWNPASFSGAMFRTSAKHVPPPPGVPPPVLWGDDAIVRQRLDSTFTDIETRLVPIDFDLPCSPAKTVTMFRTYFGPTVVAFSRLDANGQHALQADLEALWTGANTAADPEHHTRVPNEYLRVTAIRR